MKYLLILLLFCASCASMSAVGQLGKDIAALSEKPYITEADHEVLVADVTSLEEAVEADKAAGKGILNGLTGAQAGGGALGLLAAAVAAANAYRNRGLPGSTRAKA